MGAVSQAVGNAVAERDNSPRGLIKQYSTDFASVLPTHIKAAQWIRLAEGALKKGSRINAPNAKDPDHKYHGRFELEVAAANNPGVFLAALLDAARLGLEPGTEQYYLTPRKVKGQREILGIVGYQGYVELMYRAGAVSSVIVETVRENDHYRYRRGIDEVPIHEFPSFAREADRGKLIGVYAYARMRNGPDSRVIELNQDDIDRIRAVNPASDSEYSPWVKWENGMWLKSAARQLRKWVPTSAEFIREQMRAQAEAARIAGERDLPPAPADFEESIEGEIVGEQPAEAWPDTTQPADAA
jgi:recombination protein RecT